MIDSSGHGRLSKTQIRQCAESLLWMIPRSLKRDRAWFLFAVNGHISTEYSNDKRVLKLFRYDDLIFQDLSEPSIMYSNKSGNWKYEVAGTAWRPNSNREHLARS